MQTHERSGPVPREGFSWHVERAADEVVVRLSGELDMASAPELAECLQRLRDDGEQAVVLDLAALAFCDSSGLRALLTSRRQADEAGTRFVVRSANPAVRRVFELTSTDGLLERD